MSADATRAAAVDHLAVAVPDLDEAIELFTRLLGAPPAWNAENETFKVKVAVFELGGVKLELMEGTAEDSPVRRFVEKKGPGLHHVCYAVADLQGTLTRVREAGFEVLGSGHDVGVEGRPVAFLHPRGTGGVLTEFIEGVEGA